MKIPCTIIKDLLPNYIDNCTSEESNACIKEHLEGCESCKALYNEMKKPLPYEQQEEIKFLKKIKKRNTNKIILAVFLTIVLCICGVLVKSFVIGSRTTDLTISDIQLKNKTITAYVYPISTKDRIFDMKLVSEGDEQFVSYQQVLPSVFHKNNDVQPIEINIDDIEGYLLLGDFVFDKDGNVYNRMVYDLFKNRVPYVGDVSGVQKLISIAYSDIINTGYGLKLDTDKEPYSMTLTFDEEASYYDFEAMKSVANLVLASIDNCNKMTIIVGSNKFTIENSVKPKNLKELQKMVIDYKVGKEFVDYEALLKKEHVAILEEYEITLRELSSLTVKLENKDLSEKELLDLKKKIQLLSEQKEAIEERL
ncbi:DUF4825 domain-containing protein [Amedibacillus sp. YH-ame10]